MESEEFWSSVVKKWSAASDKVVQQRNEIKTLQDECSRYRSEIKLLQGKATEQVTEKSPFQASEAQTSTITKLRDAEEGLGKARMEYQRLKDELTSSTKRLQVIEMEYVKIQQEKNEIVQSRDLLAETLNKVKANLQNALSENEKLRVNIQELKAKRQKQAEITQFCEVTNDHQNFSTVGSDASLGEAGQYDALQEKTVHLEQENKKLKLVAVAYETESKLVRQELGAANDSLHKAKENNKSLLETISKLQSITKSKPSVNLELRPSSERVTTALNNAKVDLIDLTRSDDITFVDQNSTSLSATTSLPPMRQREVNKLPLVVLEKPGRIGGNGFSRELLREALGGSIQSLIVRVTESQTELSKSRGISTYLCPGLEHNPWCPTAPGQHGYIFVGLGKEKDTFSTVETRTLFVGLKNNHNAKRQYIYLGLYKVLRVNSLSVDEWKSLPASFKPIYAKTTKDKTRDARTPKRIADAYEEGELHVPCLRLQCIGFDEGLHTALLDIQTRIQATSVASRSKRPRADSIGHDPTYQKRRSVR